MNKAFLLSAMALCFMSPLSNAQDIKVSPEDISTAVYHDVFGPLSDIPPLTREELEALKEDAKKKRNKELKDRVYPFADQALPKGPDPARQTKMGTVNNREGIIQNFSGQSTFSNPPDCNGTAGPNHYMQTINVTYTIYDKSGNTVAGPSPLNTLFSGVPGANNNDGDPVILYDDQADRWLVAEFSGVFSNPDYMLIAVSQTDDPSGLWDRWSFIMNGFPDYMKFGVWSDGYYMGTNTSGGSDIYVFERSAMLNGSASPRMVQFDNPNRPASGFHCVLPVDNDGFYAPFGTPGMFMTINDDAWGYSDQLWVYELDVNWANVNLSTFQRVQTIDVASFDANFGSTWENIVQPGTNQKLDAIPQVLMHRAQYRNFGDTQRIVCNHTVDVNGADQAGIRWYELEHNGTEWEVRQYGTYAPDNLSRWMGSIAMNADKEIALGYSVSSSSVYPGIRYTGQTAAENAAASGIMDVQEVSIYEGTASQTSSERWGDYANLAVDPVDERTFWFTTQYNINSSNKGTKVASFELPYLNILSVDVTADPDEVCQNDSTQLYANASGGSGSYTFSWTSVPEGFSSMEQNPTVIPLENTMYFVEVDDGSDIVMDSVQVTVNPLPDIILGTWPEMLCNVGVPPVQLTAEPVGGIYGGDGVSPDGLFDPQMAQIGWNEITYTYEDDLGCINSAMDSIYVDNCVGISESASGSGKVRIFPNPNDGNFTIVSDALINKVMVFDQKGRMVYSLEPDSKNISIEGISSKGLYYISVYFIDNNIQPVVVGKEVVIQ